MEIDILFYAIDDAFSKNLPEDIPLSSVEKHLHPMGLSEVLYFESRLGFRHLHPLIFWYECLQFKRAIKRQKIGEREKEKTRETWIRHNSMNMKYIDIHIKMIRLPVFD